MNRIIDGVCLALFPIDFNLSEVSQSVLSNQCQCHHTQLVELTENTPRQFCYTVKLLNFIFINKMKQASRNILLNCQFYYH